MALADYDAVCLSEPQPSDPSTRRVRRSPSSQATNTGPSLSITDASVARPWSPARGAPAFEEGPEVSNRSGDHDEHRRGDPNELPAPERDESGEHW